MSSLQDIQLQIQKLQKQEADIRTREFDKTVEDIRSTMQAFGITFKDLQAPVVATRKTKGRGKAASVAAKTSKKEKASRPVPPKFRGPNGELWSGRGLMPKWLSALVDAGQPKEDFAISE